MVHVKIIIRLVAVISLIVCGFMLPCAVVAAYNFEIQALKAFLSTMGMMIFVSVPILFLIRNNDKPTISPRDGFLLVFVVWLSASMFASAPFYLSGALTNHSDAFFEAASGISATGATVISNVEILPLSIILWRSISHWMGGMGIVVMSVAIMPILGIGGIQLFAAEAGARDDAKLAPRIAQTAKFIWFVYTGFTILIFGLLYFGGMGAFDAVNHAMSSISSGGFSSKSNGIKHFESAYIQWVTIVAMFMAGVSFAMYFRLFTGRFSMIRRNTELKAYFFIIVFAGAFVTLVNFAKGVYGEFGLAVRHSFFQVTSIATSTGFSTADYTNWPHLAQCVLFLLMLTGGCAGSTAGGLKVVRVVIMFKQALNEMRRLVRPRGVFTLRLNGTIVKETFVRNVAGFFFLYMLSVVLVMFVVSTAEVDLLTAFSAGLAIMGNIGVGFGMIGPEFNFGFFPDYVKWTLGLAMIVGRLEMYTFFILLMPFFWRRY